MCIRDRISDDNTILSQMQKKQLEMLRELDRVCEKNNLKYALSSGTCLGAVRHGGFIPWDDDIDVYMLSLIHILSLFLWAQRKNGFSV